MGSKIISKMKCVFLLSLATSAVLSISISDKMDRMIMTESREGPYVMDQEIHPMMKLFMKNNPYVYMKDPMASVPLSRMTPYHHQAVAKPYHDHPHPHDEDHPHDQHPHPHPHTQSHVGPPPQPNPYRKTFEDMMSYMVGEQYFKHQNGDIINFLNDGQDESDEEELPYEVIQKYGSYEKRKIFSAQYVCAHEKVDTATDPLAGLSFNGVEDALEVMKSRRWQKLPSSRMFKELFKYISGVNDRAEEIDMTRPVTTLHHVKRRDKLGDVEIQEMCFYLPEKYQPSHTHEDEKAGPSPRHADGKEKAGPSPRHAASQAPQPLDDQVFITTRPEMEVYVRQFGGFMMSEEQWVEQKKALQNDLMQAPSKPHHDNEFFTVGYSSPFTFKNRRNEVWVQCLDPGHPVVEAVVAAGPWDDNDLGDNDDLDHITLDNKRKARGGLLFGK